ncbi:hypothetical protein [Halocatena marina]|nr:hypothetical protein [Halocatena marina]
MSFTAAYSGLFALDTDGESLERPPRILDRDRFEMVSEQVDLSEAAFQSMRVLGEETDQSTYPTQTWTTLKGFKTHTPADTLLDTGTSTSNNPHALVERIKRHEDRDAAPLGYCYNIERMGIPYGGLHGEWQALFCAVSEYTEPFGLYHSPREYSFPDLTEFEDGPETVYYAEFDVGIAYIEERTFEHTATEVLLGDE